MPCCRMIMRYDGVFVAEGREGKGSPWADRSIFNARVGWHDKQNKVDEIILIQNSNSTRSHRSSSSTVHIFPCAAPLGVWIQTNYVVLRPGADMIYDG